MTRARPALVLSLAASGRRRASDARRRGSTRRRARHSAAEEEIHEEELFGPAEGLHSTYRMLRDEVLEASWRAGAALSEMRLDTADDVNPAVARYLELVKLAALIQRPGDEPAPEAIDAINELLGRVATPEQRTAIEASALDEYVLGEERERDARRDQVAARREPSLEQFLPRREGGLGLSASDIDLYRTCPLKYKFARVFAIPQEPTINQRFGILIHQVLERFHAEELRAAAGGVEPMSAPAGGLDRLLGLFEAGWRRQGFGASDDELQYRDRAVAALARYHERHARSELAAGLARAQLHLRDRPPPAARPRRPRRPPSRRRLRADRLQDRRPGRRAEARRRPPARALPARRPRGLGDRGRRSAATGTCSPTRRSRSTASPTTPSGSSAPCSRSPTGSTSQDFEPRPSHEICSWCDYRLICPASEA